MAMGLPNERRVSVPSEASPIVQLIVRIFDVYGTGLMGFEEFQTLFSAVQKTDWDDWDLFEEWCNLVEADPGDGLDAESLDYLLSLEPGFLKDVCRLLGLEALLTSDLPPPGMRAHLLRTSIEAERKFAPGLVMSWCCDFLRLMAEQLAVGLGMPRFKVALHSSSITNEEVEVLDGNLMEAMHELVDATISAVGRWHGLYQGSKVATRRKSQVAAYDKSIAKRVAALKLLMAKVKEVAVLRHEVADAGPMASIFLVWKYCLSVASLAPLLKTSKPHGFDVPAKQVAKVESILIRIRRSTFADTPPGDQQRESTEAQPPSSEQGSQAPAFPALGSRRQYAAHLRSLTQSADTKANALERAPVKTIGMNRFGVETEIELTRLKPPKYTEWSPPKLPKLGLLFFKEKEKAPVSGHLAGGYANAMRSLRNGSVWDRKREREAALKVSPPRQHEEFAFEVEEQKFFMPVGFHMTKEGEEEIPAWAQPSISEPDGFGPCGDTDASCTEASTLDEAYNEKIHFFEEWGPCPLTLEDMADMTTAGLGHVLRRSYASAEKPGVWDELDVAGMQRQTS